MTPAPRARAPGRPPRRSPAAGLDAADALLSAEGVEAVTIRRVAQSLGASPMALYRHVGDKDDLLLALIDRLAKRRERPALPADPRGRLLVLWQTLHDGLAAHPWLPEVLARRRLMAPSVWEQALAAGATVIDPLPDQFDGVRGGRRRDPHGQQLMVSRRIESLSDEEMARREARYLEAGG